jgi:cytochrome b561
MLKNNSTQYGSVAKFFHWAIFILVGCMLLAGYFMGDIADKALRGQVINLHKLTGITILILMILRLLWAFVNPRPVLPIDMPKWQKTLAWISHGFLYAVVIAMPLSGWIGSSAAGYAPHLFDWNFLLPIQNKELSKPAFALHDDLAIIIMALVSIHMLAALYHHFIRKDNILRRMLPFTKAL